jgi:hypothetical protein
MVTRTAGGALSTTSRMYHYRANRKIIEAFMPPTS